MAVLLSLFGSALVAGCAPAGGDACGTFVDGDFSWGEWTCTSAAGTVDVRAFAISLGIESVDQTVLGGEGVVDVSYSGGAACARTTAFTIEYPTCGTVTTTTATDFACTATCDPATCTSGTQASLTDTYDITDDGTTVTTTRVLDEAFLAQGTLQSAAGCQVGDTEVATMIRQ